MTTVSRSGVVVALVVVLAGLIGPAGAQGRPGEERYYVELGPRGSSDDVRRGGGRVVHEFPRYGLVAAWLSTKARDNLARNPNVLAIETDPRRYPLTQTTPWGISTVQADESPVAGASPSHRKVCIIDSGYYRDHDDLASSGVSGTNDSGTGNWYSDACGHGTHVAGTIAAMNDDLGVVGAAPGVGLHIVKVFGDDCGWTYSSSLVAALDRCLDAGANVVNMSLGGSFKSRFEDRAFRDAYQANVLSVAAAGNAGNGSRSYPASYPSVISVAALDSSLEVASFSQRNTDVELAAPGVGVLSTVPWLSDSSLTVEGTTYDGNPLENAPQRSASGALVDGGLCDATGAWKDKVVLCERGSISFFDKVWNVQSGDGAAAVIYNDASGNFSGTLGSTTAIAIPAISLSREDGQAVLGAHLGQTGEVVSVFEKPASGYEAWDGTSMATPHVAGVAALVWSHDPRWTNDDIRGALAATAVDLGAPGRDEGTGYGLVQANDALAYLQGSSPVCTVTEGSEATCNDGLDNDCDGAVDAADADCSTAGTCDAGQIGDICTADADCCSGKCRGKPGAQTCR